MSHRQLHWLYTISAIVLSFVLGYQFSRNGGPDGKSEPPQAVRVPGASEEIFRPSVSQAAWHYKVISTEDLTAGQLEDTANSLSKDGWEPVGTTSSFFIFKRCR
jgi:hypothetical protein